MKPRKLQILKQAAQNEDDPMQLVILEGLIKLFEWQDKMIEICPVIDFGNEILEYLNEHPCHRDSGYFYSFSKNFNIDDVTRWKDEKLEVSDDEAVRDVFNYSMIAICVYVRDLAHIYRENQKVQKLVNELIDMAASNAKENHSWKNILKRGWFMNDFQIEQMRNIYIQEHCKQER